MITDNFLGVRGSGKTTWLIAQAKAWQEEHPDKKISFTAPVHQCHRLKKRLIEEGIDAEVLVPRNLIDNLRGRKGGLLAIDEIQDLFNDSNPIFREHNRWYLFREVETIGMDLFYTENIT
jgi:hypothetical protein